MKSAIAIALAAVISTSAMAGLDEAYDAHYTLNGVGSVFISENLNEREVTRIKVNKGDNVVIWLTTDGRTKKFKVQNSWCLVDGDRTTDPTIRGVRGGKKEELKNFLSKVATKVMETRYNNAILNSRYPTEQCSG